MKSFTALALLAAGALATPVDFVNLSGQAPDPNQIYIISAMTSGNGCPQGSVSTTFDPNQSVVTFGFDSFQTYIGPGTTIQDHSKNCQIHLNLHCTWYYSGLAVLSLKLLYRSRRFPILCAAGNLPRLCANGYWCYRTVSF